MRESLEKNVRAGEYIGTLEPRYALYRGREEIGRERNIVFSVSFFFAGKSGGVKFPSAKGPPLPSAFSAFTVRSPFWKAIFMSSSSALTDFIAGCAGGVAQVLSGHPLDTLKVRLQTSGSGSGPQFNGMMDCLMKTIRSEGFFGLYKVSSSSSLSSRPEFCC
jgi:hypothetical protein